MRIGVDARPLAGPPAGIRTYLSELLNAVAGLDDRNEFILYAHRPIAFDLPGNRFQVRIRSTPMGVGTLWLQLHAPRHAVEDGLDVFWGAHFLLPLRLPRHIPATVTIYDLVPFFFPQTMQLSNYLATRFLVPPSLARAQRIMVISESVAADVRRMFRIPSDRISVVPPGVRSEFTPRDPLEARRRVVERLDVDARRPYLLSVGTVEPRKNLLTLVKALASLPRATRARFSLVVAGAPGWKTSALHAAAMGLVRDGTVKFLGFVNHDDLPWLYAGAAMFLFPSLYEGFGIPVIEAMASGVPVVGSDIPVMREVARDAAAFVAPTAAEEWAKAIVDLLDDAPRQAQMRERGLAQSAGYTFKQSARRLLDVFEALAGRLRS
ncbi:MAG: hypothetical protein AUJ01_14445 [Acidobacteria bacterium 13_1_40CM_3_65_5]|nr:MAG: hypothetical protein AUJ01_14445 [Acidobacteria bacterium 13_1_40CM_3_65_5]